MCIRDSVHRWTSGDDFVALIWLLRQLLADHGTLERAFAAGLDASDADVEQALDRFATRARAVDFRPAYGRRPRRPGVFYFLPCPSAGSACKRLNLFLRWMVRKDAVDPGGWSAVAPRHLIMMGACGFHMKKGNSQCPLRAHCKPRKPAG